MEETTEKPCKLKLQRRSTVEYVQLNNEIWV